MFAFLFITTILATFYVYYSSDIFMKCFAAGFDKKIDYLEKLNKKPTPNPARTTMRQ